MKKVLIGVLSISLLLSLLAGCQKSPTEEGIEPAESNLSGSASEVLAEILEESGADFGMTFEDSATADTAQSYLGLSEAQFDQYVSDAYYSMGALTTHAHLVAVIQCNDAEAAQEVKQLVAEGFDSGRWVCVAPEESFVVESGAYVLLAATDSEGADALKTAFSAIAGSTGEVNVFYTGR